MPVTQAHNPIIHIDAAIKRIVETIESLDNQGNPTTIHTITLVTTQLSRNEYLRLTRVQLRQEHIEVDLIVRQFELPLPVTPPTRQVDRVTGELLGPFDALSDEPDAEPAQPASVSLVAPLDGIQDIALIPEVDYLPGPAGTIEVLLPSGRAKVNQPSAWEASQWLRGIRVGDTVAVLAKTDDQVEMAAIIFQGVVQGIENGQFLVRDEMGIGKLHTVSSDQVRFMGWPKEES